MDNLDHMMSTTLMLEDGQEEEEVLCSKVMERKVPRLPVIASVYKFKQLEKRDGKHRGRGRASMLRKYEESRPGKQAVVQKCEESDTMALKRHSPSPDIESTPQCNGHWKNEDFPQLGKEPQLSARQATKQTMIRTGNTDSTVPIQPKMIKLTSASTSTCDTDRTNLESVVETDTSQPPYNLTHNDFSHNVVKPKTKKVEKINSAEHYKNILMEFQSISDNSKFFPKRIMNLTKANLERHAREMDSSDMCKIRSGSKDVVENVRKQNADEQMEAYEKYQVTLDDIQRFKHQQNQVPSNVKGMLASLLNDETDNIVKGDPTGVGMDVVGLERDNQMLDCAINDGEHCGAEELGSAGRLEGSDNKRLEAIGTNDSMLSNLSDNELLSDDIYQSDTEEHYCSDSNNADMQEKKTCMSTTSQLDEFPLERKEIVNEPNRTEVNNRVIPDRSIPGNGEVSVNECRKDTEDTGTVLDTDSPLIDTDVLHDSKVNDEFGSANSNDHDVDLEDFQEVKYKHKRKKSHKGSPETVYSSIKAKPDPANTIWRLYGSKVIQISGLPVDFDVTVLLEVVGGFGQITDHQVRCIDNGCCVRIEFFSEDDGDYAVETLHDTDCLFADADCVLQCEKLNY